MRHRSLALALLPVIVLLAACGGSSSSSTTPAVPTSSSTSTAAASSASGVSATGATTSSTATSRTGSGSSPSGTTRPTGGATPAPGGSVNARVPATFSLHPGGKLTPVSVSAPAFLAVDISIDSTDTRSHQIVLRTPTPHTFTVPAHGHASLLIPGLRAGAYALDIDGSPKGSLIIGGEPGP